MLPVMTAALSGALTYQAVVDEVAHNLANLSTPAFRPTRLAQVERVAFGDAAEGGRGVVPVARRVSARPGPPAETGSPFDIALADDGRSFFRVRLPDGTYAYTRRGDLRLDGDGRLVTFDGLPLDPEIRVPPGARVEIRPDGSVVAEDGGEPLGRLEVFTFDRPENLEPLGGGFYRESAASGPPRPRPQAAAPEATAAEPALLPGYLEMSGADLVGELTRLIQAQRAYTLNLRVIRDQDQLIGQAIELARG